MDRSIYLCLLSLTFLFPLLASPWGYDNAILVKEFRLLIVTGGLLVLFFLKSAGQWRLRTRVTPLDKPALSLAGIALFFVTTRARFDPRRIETLAKAAVASGVLVTVYAFMQYLRLDPFGRTEPFSTLSNPNYAAEYLASLIPISLAFAISRREAWEKYPGPEPGCCLRQEGRDGEGRVLGGPSEADTVKGEEVSNGSCPRPLQGEAGAGIAPTPV